MHPTPKRSFTKTLTFTTCRTIANLQKLNAELQAEMQQVVSGLTGVMKTMSKATAQSPLPTSSPNGSASTSAAAASDSTITRQVDIDAPASKVHNGTHASKSELSHFASSCVVQHPGALCCTNIAAKTDPISGTCTVTIKTTAKYVSFFCFFGGEIKHFLECIPTDGFFSNNFQLQTY